MEPGHEDREYALLLFRVEPIKRPQWSPVMKTGNTTAPEGAKDYVRMPQWSPVMKTGNTDDRPGGGPRREGLNGARS